MTIMTKTTMMTKTMMKMSNIDCILFSYRNLHRKKIRTILTMVGVIIGSFALIIMIGFGIGMSENIDKTISAMGDLTILDVTSFGTYTDENGNFLESDLILDQDIINTISQMDGVIAVFPFLEINGLPYIISTNTNYSLKNVSIIGINPEYLELFDYSYSTHNKITVYDDFLLFGQEAVLDFYDNSFVNPPEKDHFNLDGTLKEPQVVLEKGPVDFELQYDEEIKGREYHIDNVGIIKGPSTDYSTPLSIYTNINLLKKLIREYKQKVPPGTRSDEISKINVNHYTKLKIKTADLEAASQVENCLSSVGIPTYGLSTYRKQMLQTKNTIQMVLLGIGIMALFISVLGISNTTIMSIYERTPEIAVIKVVGGAESDIRKLFYMESGLIGFMGGLFGAIISIIMSAIFNNISNISLILGLESSSGILRIPFWLLILSILFTTIIGVVAGALPAKRAVSISIINALNN